MTDQEIKDLAAAYGVFAHVMQVTKNHYGGDHIGYEAMCKKLERNARNALGDDFALAKWAYEVRSAGTNVHPVFTQMDSELATEWGTGTPYKNVREMDEHNRKIVLTYGIGSEEENA